LKKKHQFLREIR